MRLSFSIILALFSFAAFAEHVPTPKETPLERRDRERRESKDPRMTDIDKQKNEILERIKEKKKDLEERKKKLQENFEEAKKEVKKGMLAKFNSEYNQKPEVQDRLSGAICGLGAKDMGMEEPDNLGDMEKILEARGKRAELVTAAIERFAQALQSRAQVPVITSPTSPLPAEPQFMAAESIGVLKGNMAYEAGKILGPPAGFRFAQEIPSEMPKSPTIPVTPVTPGEADHQRKPAEVM